MIVVPTSNDVTLTYDSRSTLDWFFYLLTAVGIGLCFLWRRQGDVRHADVRPVFGVAGGGGHFEDRDGDDVDTAADPPQMPGEAIEPTPIQTSLLLDGPSVPDDDTVDPDDEDRPTG